MRTLRVAIIALPLALFTGCANQTRKLVSVGDNYRAAQTHFENALGPVQLPQVYNGPPPADPAQPPPTLPSDTPPTLQVGRPDAFEAWQVSLDDVLRTSMANSDIVRVLNSTSVTAGSTSSYDPQSAEANARAALAAFDPYLTSAAYYSRINQPSGEFFGPGIPEATRYNTAGVTSALVKPLVTGGQASIAYNPPVGYQYYPNGVGSFLNPLNTANVEYAFRQPLLRGFGTNVNKAPIRIAQLQADQSKWDFKANLLASIRSVCEAYWSLQAAHVALQTLDEIVPLMEEVVHLEEERLKAERSIVANVARARANLHNVRQQRLLAQSTVYERELRLRNLIGLPPRDGRYFVPTAAPVKAPITIDSRTVVANALAYRPDLIRQRLNIRTRELQLLVAKNAYLPQLDATGLYRMNGIGATQGQAIDQVFSSQFADYQTGILLNVPLGRRAATAGVQNAEIMLARERAMMRQAVHSAAHSLGDIIRQMEFSYRQYQEAEARWRENTVWLENERFRFQNPPPAVDGQDLLALMLNNYLAAMQSQYTAATDAATLLAQYNTQLVRLDEAMGTLAMSFNIALEGDAELSPRQAALLAADVYKFGLPVGPYYTDIPAKPSTRIPIPPNAMPGPTTQGYDLPPGDVGAGATQASTTTPAAPTPAQKEPGLTVNGLRRPPDLNEGLDSLPVLPEAVANPNAPRIHGLRNPTDFGNIEPPAPVNVAPDANSVPQINGLRPPTQQTLPEPVLPAPVAPPAANGPRVNGLYAPIETEPVSAPPPASTSNQGPRVNGLRAAAEPAPFASSIDASPLGPATARGPRVNGLRTASLAGDVISRPLATPAAPANVSGNRIHGLRSIEPSEPADSPETSPAVRPSGARINGLRGMPTNYDEPAAIAPRGPTDGHSYLR
ncbi:MAG: TolC family protein [Planctomycetes bacterium]|nr:TolC family protein [Planctomycetota bacterium]